MMVALLLFSDYKAVNKFYNLILGT